MRTLEEREYVREGAIRALPTAYSASPAWIRGRSASPRAGLNKHGRISAKRRGATVSKRVRISAARDFAVEFEGFQAKGGRVRTRGDDGRTSLSPSIKRFDNSLEHWT